MLGNPRRYTFKLYPNAAQAAALDAMRRAHCVLYNAALQERIDAYRLAGVSLTHYDQSKSLKQIRADDPVYAAMSADSLALTLGRLDLAFKAFFRRAKAGAGAASGFPRFMASDRYVGMSFREAGKGWRLELAPPSVGVNAGAPVLTVAKVNAGNDNRGSGKVKAGTGTDRPVNAGERTRSGANAGISGGNAGSVSKVNAGNPTKSEYGKKIAAKKAYFKGIPGLVKLRGKFPTLPIAVKTCDVSLRAGIWTVSVVCDMPARMRHDAYLDGEIRFDLIDSFARVRRVDGGCAAGPEDAVYAVADGRITSVTDLRHLTAQENLGKRDNRRSDVSQGRDGLENAGCEGRIAGRHFIRDVDPHNQQGLVDEANAGRCGRTQGHGGRTQARDVVPSSDVTAGARYGASSGGGRTQVIQSDGGRTQGPDVPMGGGGRTQGHDVVAHSGGRTQIEGISDPDVTAGSGRTQVIQSDGGRTQGHGRRRQAVADGSAGSGRGPGRTQADASGESAGKEIAGRKDGVNAGSIRAKRENAGSGSTGCPETSVDAGIAAEQVNAGSGEVAGAFGQSVNAGAASVLNAGIGYQPISETQAIRHRSDRVNAGKTKGVEALQQRMARCKKYSYRYRQLRQRKARLEARTARQRRETLHVWTTDLARDFSHLRLIKPPLIEATKTGAGWEKNHGAQVELKAKINRHMLDQAPGAAIQMLAYKIAERGGSTDIIEDDAAPALIGNMIVIAAKATRKLKRTAARAS